MSRKKLASLLLFVLLTPVVAVQHKHQESAASDVRLMALDPSQFHAALLQKEMLPGLSWRVYVSAPPSTCSTAPMAAWRRSIVSQLWSGALQPPSDNSIAGIAADVIRSEPDVTSAPSQGAT